MLATDVADYLVGRGVPFRKAHEIVAGMVRTLIERGRSFESLSVEEWRALDDHFDADVVDKVTARQSVAARKTPQSTAPDAVAAALADARAWVEKDTRWSVRPAKTAGRVYRRGVGRENTTHACNSYRAPVSRANVL